MPAAAETAAVAAAAAAAAVAVADPALMTLAVAEAPVAGQGQCGW